MKTILLIIFLHTFLAFGQRKNPNDAIKFMFTIELVGKVSDEQNLLGLDSVLVQLFQDEKEVTRTYADKRKGYSIIQIVDVAHPFYIKFSKNGYFSKSVCFSFKGKDIFKMSSPPKKWTLLESLDIGLSFNLPIYEDIQKDYCVAQFTLVDGTPSIDEEYDIIPLNSLKNKYTGAYDYHNDEGTLIATLHYLDGEIDGRCVWFYPNGREKLVIHYSKGEMDGKYLVYNAKNRIVKEKIYKNGIEVN